MIKYIISKVQNILPFIDWVLSYLFRVTFLVDTLVSPLFYLINLFLIPQIYCNSMNLSIFQVSSWVPSEVIWLLTELVYFFLWTGTILDIIYKIHYWIPANTMQREQTIVFYREKLRAKDVNLPFHVINSHFIAGIESIMPYFPFFII